jgi:hypothetical protein
MDDKIFEIAAELARIERRRRTLLSELLKRKTDITEKNWKLVEEVAGLRENKVEEQQVFRFNLLHEIRELLASNPLFEFPAARIREELRIPPSMEKSFYAALAKLTGTGQIRRVRRAVYQAMGGEMAPVRKRTRHRG